MLQGGIRPWQSMPRWALLSVRLPIRLRSHMLFRYIVGLLIKLCDTVECVARNASARPLMTHRNSMRLLRKATLCEARHYSTFCLLRCIAVVVDVSLSMAVCCWICCSTRINLPGRKPSHRRGKRSYVGFGSGWCC